MRKHRGGSSLRGTGATGGKLKIHWLHFNVNFFDEPKIKIISKQKSGDTILKIWIHLLCMAMKAPRPGFVEMSDGIPYDIEGLSTCMDVSERTLEDSLKLFLRLGMIDVKEGTPIEIISFRRDQNLDYIEVQNEKARLRMKKYREKAGLLPAPEAPVTRNNIERSRMSQGIGEERKGEEKKGEERIGNELQETSPIGSVKPDGVLFLDAIFEHHKSGLLKADTSRLYSKASRAQAAEIVSHDGLDGALAVVGWGWKDSFWGGQILFPALYTKVRAACESAKTGGKGGSIEDKSNAEIRRFLNERK